MKEAITEITVGMLSTMSFAEVLDYLTIANSNLDLLVNVQSDVANNIDASDNIGAFKRIFKEIAQVYQIANRPLRPESMYFIREINSMDLRNSALELINRGNFRGSS